MADIKTRDTVKGTITHHFRRKLRFDKTVDGTFRANSNSKQIEFDRLHRLY